MDNSEPVEISDSGEDNDHEGTEEQVLISDSDEDGAENGEAAPSCKIPKLDPDEVIVIEDDDDVIEVTHTMKINPKLTDAPVVEKLKQLWSEKSDLRDDETGIQLFSKPFQMCVVQNFLSDDEMTNLLVREMNDDLSWNRKKMDLYEFEQTDDLSRLSAFYMQKFMNMLRLKVGPWLEEICNIKLTSVAASCSMYTCRDYLLVHDDLIKDRQIAFVFYLTPWPGVTEWSDDMGGCLEIFNCDEYCFPHFPIVRKIHPKDNQFVFFKVGSKSFHQVGEVTTEEYTRLTINGWFYGEMNTDTVDESKRPIQKVAFEPPLDLSVNLEGVINPAYLKGDHKQQIQKHIENKSEICLEQFLIESVYSEICNELKTNNALRWKLKGPANEYRYEVLDIASATGHVKLLIDTFTCKQMFTLLYELTELDLSGPNVDEPKMSYELQRWVPGCYTIWGDTSNADESTLDALVFFNTSHNIGATTYLNPDIEDELEDEEDVPLIVTPIDNSLSIIYRCQGTTKFTKYVSKTTPTTTGPVFILSCAYKE